MEFHGMDKSRGDAPSASSGSGEPLPARNEQLQRAIDYHKQGRLLEAEALYVALLTAEPQNFYALNRLGILKYQCGHLDEAHRLLRAAIARNPHSDRALLNYATVLLAQKRFEDALENCDRALALKPGDPDTLYNRGPFYLAYQEENNRKLFARYGELCAQAAGQIRAKKQHHKWSLKSPLRVGIVSAHVRQHSVWDALLKGFMQRLDPGRIQIDVFHTGAVTDAETVWAMSRSAHFEQGEIERVETWTDRILARQPDVLLYPEIGMDPTIVYLASQRLADLQVAMWGQPHTTGLPTIDAFISAEALVPPDAEDHYSETLIRLPRLGCCIAPHQVDATTVDLEALGITQDRPLLLSPGTPYKYAPQHDWVFPEIAKRLGRCTIALFEDKSVPWADLNDPLRERLATAFNKRGLSFSDTCVVLPWQEGAAYYALMQRADILLDTIGFSGFNTAMQAMESGLPIVTRQGRFMRGRLASGILRSIGLEELIAMDEDHCVDLAVALVSDKNRRDAIRRRIEQRRDGLFNDVQAAHACQEHLLKLASK
jgi:protein O-GlcNAc transferase